MERFHLQREIPLSRAQLGCQILLTWYSDVSITAPPMRVSSRRYVEFSFIDPELCLGVHVPRQPFVTRKSVHPLRLSIKQDFEGLFLSVFDVVKLETKFNTFCYIGKLVHDEN